MCVCVWRERGGQPFGLHGWSEVGWGGGPEDSAGVLCLCTVNYIWCDDMCLRLLLQVLCIVAFVVSIFLFYILLLFVLFDSAVSLAPLLPPTPPPAMNDLCCFYVYCVFLIFLVRMFHTACLAGI